jgi:hypothetical protein
MKIIKILRFLHSAKHQHFLSVDKKTYDTWKWIIKTIVSLNKNYKSCEIFRKKYKIMENFVVVGLKYNGKNVKRRTSGYAKGNIKRHSKCPYCGVKLTTENATTDHIVPISNGGNNCQVNLVVCCEKCNIERGNLPFMKYIKLKNKNLYNKKEIFI